MSVRRLVIVGGSGHARVVLDAARLAGHEVLGLVDPRLAPGALVDGAAVLGGDEALGALDGGFACIVGIGDNAVRRRVAESLAARYPALWFASVLHPSAVVAATAKVQEGAFVAAGALINAGACVGWHAIINTGATVDHECDIGDFASVGPNAALAGNVAVGRGAMIGIGACAVPGVRIGDGAVIGAGAAVVADIAPGVTAVGVPARPLPPPSPAS